MTLTTMSSPRARRMRTLAVLGAVTIGVGAIALSAASASVGAPTMHTLRVTTTQLRDVLVHQADIATDVDRQGGTTTGYDVTSCRVSTRTHLASCDVALARAGGVIYGHATVSVVTGQGSGKVTGGARGFTGAKGTITIAPGSAANTSKITISYHV